MINSESQGCIKILTFNEKLVVENFHWKLAIWAAAHGEKQFKTISAAEESKIKDSCVKIEN